jgi:hypothetical protein
MLHGVVGGALGLVGGKSMKSSIENGTVLLESFRRALFFSGSQFNLMHGTLIEELELTHTILIEN